MFPWEARAAHVHFLFPETKEQWLSWLATIVPLCHINDISLLPWVAEALLGTLCLLLCVAMWSILAFIPISQFFSRPFLLSFLCPVSHTAADLNFRRHSTFTGRAHRFHCIETTAVPRPHRICIKILEHSNHVKIWAQADLQRHPPHLGIALKVWANCHLSGTSLLGNI